MTTHEAAKIILGAKQFDLLYVEMDLAMPEIMREAAVRCFIEERNDVAAQTIRTWLKENVQ